MFITPAYAQGAADGGLFGSLGMIGPLILIFIIMYFLVIRPQRQQMKKQQDMVNATRRGDTVVTAGGLIGKVTRVFDESNEIEVEIAEDVRVRVVRSTLANVRTKGDVAKESTAESKKPAPTRRKAAAAKGSTVTRSSSRGNSRKKAVAEPAQAKEALAEESLQSTIAAESETDK